MGDYGWMIGIGILLICFFYKFRKEIFKGKS
jgi:hypothetical protein